MMYYSIKSVGVSKVKVPALGVKKSIEEQLEDIFFEKYQNATTEERRLKYLKYYNHVLELRNRTQYSSRKRVV
jgi:hypothetical protein